MLTVLACGPGGRHVVSGLTHRLRAVTFSEADTPRLTVVGGTAEDITLCGLRLCPDLDALAEILAPVTTPGADPTHEVMDHLRRLRAAPEWYPIDDATFARAIARSRDLGSGLTPTQICSSLLADDAPVRLLPMTDQPVETHVVLEDGDGARAVHVLEWVMRDGARTVSTRITAAGLAQARPAPGVLDAIRGADAIVLPLALPVTSLGILLGLPGVRDTLRGTSAPVVGIAPRLLPARGDEAATLATLDLDHTSRDVLGLVQDVLDACLVPADELEELRAIGHLRDVRLVGVGGEPDARTLADELMAAVGQPGRTR